MTKQQAATRLEDLERRYSGEFAPDSVIREIDHLMTVDTREGTCGDCHRTRTIGTDWLCHECRVALQDEGAVTDEDGEIFVPGGSRL